ncbi:hypothetical protein [Halomontanus rarus]|uniref:hypothetical protein n=1 Tax=Halomontanus rarus TaxID=3034020 RepID=UPI0023E83CF3|nr:hypothetical protein [Halovivax sp. TS33]
MQRRALLALTTALLAGCQSVQNSTPANPGGKNYTAPADVHVYDDLREMPEPPESVNRDSAREYVEMYEKRRIYNELLGENVSEDHEGHVSSGDDRDVVELNIEPLESDLLRETDHGYYFITSISGRAEHWCEDELSTGRVREDGSDDEEYGRGCGSSTGRNNHTIVHFVDSNFHMRIPYDWYTCAGIDDPYTSSDDAENVKVSEHDSAAQLQVYNVTGDEYEVDVTVRFTDGSQPEMVYSETVSTPPYLAVLSNLVQRRGTYEVEAELETGYTETFEWEITSDTAASWAGTSIFITPTEEFWIDTIDPEAAIEITPTSCRNRLRDRDDHDTEETDEQ